MALRSGLDPTWRTMDEAAQETGISRRTLTRWVSEGKLRPRSRFGDRKHYIDLEAIKRLQELGPIDRVAGSSKYIGDISVIPPDDPKWQPVYGIVYQLGVMSHSLRPLPQKGNVFSLQFPLEVWAIGHADARAQLLNKTREAVKDQLEGTRLDPKQVKIAIVPDTVHGPSLP